MRLPLIPLVFAVAMATQAQDLRVTITETATGGLEAEAHGGVAPYTFAWSKAATQRTKAGGTNVKRTVVVTDAIGATASASHVEYEPPTATTHMRTRKPRSSRLKPEDPASRGYYTHRILGETKFIPELPPMDGPSHRRW